MSDQIILLGNSEMIDRVLQYIEGRKGNSNKGNIVVEENNEYYTDVSLDEDEEAQIQVQYNR